MGPDHEIDTGQRRVRGPQRGAGIGLGTGLGHDQGQGGGDRAGGDEDPAGRAGHGGCAEAPVAGYREGGSGFNFVPDYRVFLSPDSLSIDDWELKLRSARSIYAPAYARHFRSLARR